MPYSLNDPTTWPADIRKLPPKKGRRWVHVFNQTFERTDIPKEDRERRAFAYAYSVVKDMGADVMRLVQPGDPLRRGLPSDHGDLPLLKFSSSQPRIRSGPNAGEFAPGGGGASTAAAFEQHTHGASMHRHQEGNTPHGHAAIAGGAASGPTGLHSHRGFLDTETPPHGGEHAHYGVNGPGSKVTHTHGLSGVEAAPARPAGPSRWMQGHMASAHNAEGGASTHEHNGKTTEHSHGPIGEHRAVEAKPTKPKHVLREPTEAEHRHEQMRMANALDRAGSFEGAKKTLRQRMNSITNPQKMHNFSLALENENMHDLAREARQKVTELGGVRKSADLLKELTAASPSGMALQGEDLERRPRKWPRQ